MTGLHALVTELGDIDAQELATFPIGGPDSGINLRVGRYGPYLEGPDDEGNPIGKRANVPDDLPPDELTLEKAQGAVRQPGGRGDRARSAPRDRPDGRRQERPLRPLRHRGAARGRQEVDTPRTGSLFKSMSLDTITLDDAVKLLSLPRVVGHDAEGEEITAQNGRYGPYLKKGTDSRSLTSEEQLLTITHDEALTIYAQPKQRGRGAATAPLKELGNDPVSGQPVVVKSGRFGEYVTDGEYNATLRKDDTVEAITLERAAELLAERRERGPAKKTAKKTAKRAPAKKTAKKTTKKAAAKKLRWSRRSALAPSRDLGTWSSLRSHRRARSRRRHAALRERRRSASALPQPGLDARALPSQARDSRGSPPPERRRDDRVEGDQGGALEPRRLAVAARSWRPAAPRAAAPTTSIGRKTSVRVASPNTWLTITSTGASTRAIWIGLLSTTEKAYSDWPLAASWTPTTFSMALPAIATMTRPAKAWEIPADVHRRARARRRTSRRRTPRPRRRPPACRRPARAASGAAPGRRRAAPSDLVPTQRERQREREERRAAPPRRSGRSVFSWARPGCAAQCASDGIAIAVTDSSHQHDDGAGPLRAELLGAVLEATDQERQAEHEQQVGQDRADQGGLDDRPPARPAARRCR